MDLKSILVPVDGSERGRRALEFAATIARLAGAELTILTVVETATDVMFEFTSTSGREMDASIERVAHARLQRATEGIDLTGTKLRREIRSGSIASEIIAYAEAHRPSLIVLAARVPSEAPGMLAGSISRKVLRNVESTVAVVH